MSGKTKLKEVYEIEKQYSAFYTGGTIAWTNDGEHFLCQDNDRINVVSIATNTKLYSIGGQDEISEDDDEMDNNLNDLIYTFALSSNDELIVTAHKSGLLKLWLIKSWKTTADKDYESIVGTNNADNENSPDNGKLLKQWKSLHQGPITKLIFHKNNEIIASAGVDSKIRLWNFEQKLCFATFHLNQGVISILSFVPEFQEKKLQSSSLALAEKLIITCGDDNIINCWNYASKQLKFKLKGHLSKVTSVTYSFCDNNYDADGNNDDIKNNNHESYYLISSSRDKVIIVWDLFKGKQLYVVPVYECIESVIYLKPLSKLKLPNNIKLNDKENIYALTGGEFGIIKIWELKSGQLLYAQTNSLIAKSTSLSSTDFTTATDESDMDNLNTGDLLIYQCLYNEKLLKFTIITVDHNILIYNINTFYCNKQLIGFTDDILDLILFGKNGRYLALATNSNDIKIYDTLNMNCQLLKGHTDIVLTLSAYKNFLLSAGKDMTIYLWEIDASNFTIKCRGIGKKHTAAIGSITFGKISNNIFASVSQDTCLKVWNIPNTITKSSAVTTASNSTENDLIIPLNCIATQIAHEKDVNCVTMSPNDKILATGSQDKTAKLWNCVDLSLIGVFRGHKRGIWCVRFSPIDQIILTTSADCTMKLWSIVDMSCLKSFEGHHTSSILRGEFLNKGLQILSAGSDGLIKLWCIKTSECLKTLDKHTNRIWAITISPDETYFYSGGSDSILMKWKDVTDEEKLTKQLQQNELILQEQKLLNLLQENDVLKALCLAIKLRKPNLTLRIITNIIKEDNINEYQNAQHTNLKETIKQLDDTEKEILFKHAITWNTIGKNSLPAQIIINIFLKEILLGTFKPNGLSKFIEDTLPYTDRHFRRMTQYLLDLKYLEFIKSSMQQHMV